MRENKEALIEAAITMSSTGLSAGRSGNVSTRLDDKVLITPSALPYDKMRIDDIVTLDIDGQVIDGWRKPSSEWQFHTAIYRNYCSARAVVHCHSTFATSLACLGKTIPAFHYMVAVAGGNNIPCCDYSTFGSETLASNVVHGLRGRKACLMQNHGQIAYAESLQGALELALEVENLSQMYWNTLQLGEPVILSDREMDKVIEKFNSYRP